MWTNAWTNRFVMDCVSTLKVDTGATAQRVMRRETDFVKVQYD